MCRCPNARDQFTGVSASAARVLSTFLHLRIRFPESHLTIEVRRSVRTSLRPGVLPAARRRPLSERTFPTPGRKRASRRGAPGRRRRRGLTAESLTDQEPARRPMRKADVDYPTAACATRVRQDGRPAIRWLLCGCKPQGGLFVVWKGNMPRGWRSRPAPPATAGERASQPP